MIDRREILKATPLAAAATWPGLAAAAAPALGGPELFVLDTRFGAIAAAAEALAGGAPIERIAGDVTDLWYERLDLDWRKRRGGALAGLTGDDALFVLERLAWDRRRKIVTRREVGPAQTDDGQSRRLIHWVIAPTAA